MRFILRLAPVLLFAVIFSCQPSEEQTEITSPNGQLKVRFHLQKGIPYYSVTYRGETFIADSRLGFELKDQPALTGDFKLVSVNQSVANQTWTQPWGEQKEIQNSYEASTIALEEKSGSKRKLNIEFRVFNDGIGFRYEFPKQDALTSFVITNELTEFVLAKKFTAWWIPAYLKEGDIEMDSEFLFRKDSVQALQEVVHTPLTMQSGDSLYISIHEAALMDYAAMALSLTQDQTLKADLVPWANGDLVEAVAPLKTPWRTIQVATKPGDLITSYLILNLNEPNQLGDVAWVTPGKYNGMWWGMHMQAYTWHQGPKHGATTKNVKDLIDFASKHKLSGVLVEGWNDGWQGNWPVDGDFNFTQAYSDYDLPQLANYAKSKNVGLIAHHETGGNISNYETQMEDAFKLLQQHNIHSLKTGYVNKRPAGEYHHSQFMVRHYQKVLETAARYQVMLDVHEPVKDTGLRRTFPNMMTREGGRGTEYEAWSIGNPPSHTTTLPFTRGLAGPFDYTPGIFNIQFDATQKFKVHTTLAKQLALYVVIYSPLHMAADLPKYYEGQPAFKFIEDVPTDWETTRVLNAAIGEYITTIRKDRHSNDWYLGSITNEEPREFNIELNFLTPEKKYKAEIYQDGAAAHFSTNPLPVEIIVKEVDATTILPIKLAAGGGTAIRFYEMN
jgi:alpha-glucosidase